MKLTVPAIVCVLMLGACGEESKDTGLGSAALPGKNPTPPAIEDPAKWKDVTEARFVAQEGWVEETPTSAMRKAQWKLPSTNAALKPAELVIYQFPGGGSVEDNFERWCKQFEQPDGRSSRERATTAVHRIGPFVVSEISVAGRYVAETTPGSGVRVDEPDWAVFGAVIEGPGGPYYVKAVGPNSTLTDARPGWEAFLSGLVP
ncbi:MAG: hypothetical protein K8S98_00015 [Planctomycetes bacterium]|nr:hypothetical protein [Planctomycetota bacterium]